MEKSADNQGYHCTNMNWVKYYHEWTNADHPGLHLLPRFSLTTPFVFDPFGDEIIDVSEKNKSCTISKEREGVMLN